MGQGRVGPGSERDLFAPLGQQIDKVQRTKWEDKVSESSVFFTCSPLPLSFLTLSLFFVVELTADHADVRPRFRKPCSANWCRHGA
jgi:hypothetical protein